MAGAAIVAATVASYIIGWAAGVPLLVPLLNTAASYPFMMRALAQRRLRLAVARMLVWAAALACCATALSYARPLATDSLFLNGAAYRAEMFNWVMTGRGAESTPSIFIPQQLVHAAVFSALALASAGLLAMPMGAVLMNYMGHYVGALAAASRRPLLTAFLGWHPWAVIRIASFVVIGVVLSGPLAARVGGFEVDQRDSRRLLAVAACGLVADILLKAIAAPAWQRILYATLG